jgi:hypothetical protein
MKTAKVYPTSEAYYYYRNGSLTSDSPFNLAYAGRTSTNTYYWFLPFNLSAYANKIIKGLKFYAKRNDSASNSPSESRLVGAGLSTSDSFAGVSGYTDLGNARSMPSGNAFVEWDITGAWNALKSGAFLSVYGNASSYTAFYTNRVSEGDRPYILVEYEEGTVGYMHTDGLHRCQAFYMHTDGLHLVQPFVMASDGLHEISV